MKLKLNPTSREKKRYLYFEVKDENPGEKIKKAILDYVGVLGYSKASPKIIEIQEKNGKYSGILSINRKEIEKIRGAFSISGIEIKKVSGTIKRLKKK